MLKSDCRIIFDRIVSENSQKEKSLTEYEPTEGQLRLLKAFQSKNYLCTVEEGCKAAGYETRQSFYDQYDDYPGFEQWWADQADLFFLRRLPAVKAAIASAATTPTSRKDKKYNPKAQELFLQRFDRGFVPRSRKDVAHGGEINLTFEQIVDKLHGMETEDDD